MPTVRRQWGVVTGEGENVPIWNEKQRQILAGRAAPVEPRFLEPLQGTSIAIEPLREPRSVPIGDLPPVSACGLRQRALDHVVGDQATSSKGKPAPPAISLEWAEAFGAEHSEDWYALSYGVTTDPTHRAWIRPAHRLTTAAPPAIREAGWIQTIQQVRGWGLIAELDLATIQALDMGIDRRAVGKVPWDDTWRERFPEILESAAERFPLLAHPTLFFTSKNGLRLVYAFDESVPVLGAGGLLDRIRGFMVQAHLAGFPIDPATGDWTRLQRLPYVMRESRDANGRPSFERTIIQEYMRASWGRVDITAQEFQAPPQALVHDPRTIPAATDFSLPELTSHPEWATISKIVIGVGDSALQGTHRIHADFGQPPPDDEVERLLAKTGRADSLLISIIKEPLKALSKRSKEDSVSARVAQHVFDVLFGGARIDLSPDGSSNLHDNTYKTVSDFCYIFIKELGTEQGMLAPRQIYALFIGPARRANEARSPDDPGLRDAVTLDDEVWRICCDVVSKKLGKRQFDIEEEHKQEQQHKEDLAAIAGGGSIAFKRLISGRFVEWFGEQYRGWVNDNIQHMMLISTNMGTTVVQVDQDTVQLSYPSSKWYEITTELRKCGHDLIRYRELPKDPMDDIKVRRQVDIMDDYGTVAAMTRASRLIPSSRLELIREGGQNHLRYVHALPGVAEDVDPVYHEVADYYLRLLGGEHYDKLLDWIACFPIIDRPLPALYIDGPSGCGKGLLIDSLKHLTSRNKVAYFSDAMGNFQDHYVETFLIVIDEDPGTAGNHHKDVVGVLRRMIGGELKQINMKGVKGIDVDGEWRLVMAANNADILEIKKDLDASDIDALSGRIFYHKVREEAGAELKEFFTSLGGRNGNQYGIGTDAMRLPHCVAQHAMWLHHNRRVRFGERYLIDAPPTPWHQSLRMNSAGGKEICKIINDVMMLMRTGKPTSGIGIIVDQERHKLYISMQNFEKYLNDQHSMRIGRWDITRLIKRMTNEETARVRLRDPIDQELYGTRPRVSELDIKAVLTTLHTNGYDCDWRRVFGEAMWRDTAPQEIQDSLKDVPVERDSAPHHLAPFQTGFVDHRKSS